MATVRNGAQGTVRGKIGNLVYCQWKDINYVRTLPVRNKKKAASPAQRTVRSRFAFVQNRLTNILPLLRVGFRNYAPNRTAHNSAMSYNLLEAVNQENGIYTLDFEKFSFAQGQPNPITSVDIEVTADQYIIHWDYDKAIRNKYCQDNYRMTFLAYPDQEDTTQVYMLQYGNMLTSNKQEIPIHELNRDINLHLYIAFQAVDGSNTTTDSMYIGLLPKQGVDEHDEEETAESPLSSSGDAIQDFPAEPVEEAEYRDATISSALARSEPKRHHVETTAKDEVIRSCSEKRASKQDKMRHSPVFEGDTKAKAALSSLDVAEKAACGPWLNAVKAVLRQELSGRVAPEGLRIDQQHVLRFRAGT